jgi:hypothetical protein
MIDDWDISGGTVQQESTATLPPGTDLIRLTPARDLRQRPASTSVRLVHTERITWLAHRGDEHQGADVGRHCAQLSHHNVPYFT